MLFSSYLAKASISSQLRLAAVALLLVLFSSAAQAQLANIQYTTESDGNGGVIITGFTATGTGALTIPSTINSLPVTAIGDGSASVFLYYGLTSATIPAGVTSIGASAFISCANLASVSIPNSVISIGSEAFAFTGLTSVTIPTDVTTIADGTFQSCPYLSSVTIPAGVTSIGSSAFSNCPRLISVTLPAGLTGIGDFAFNSTGLTGMTIPAAVSSIGLAPFNACVDLTAITVASQNTSYRSVDGVLFNADQTTLVQYPAAKAGAYTIPSSVTSIGHNAFYYSAILTSVTIPNGVTSIGDFANSPNTGTFANCTSLASVTLGSGLTSIGINEFQNDALTNLTIPASVATIGNGAFSQAYGSGLKSAIFLGNAPTMGYSVFGYAGASISVGYYNGATGFTSPTWVDSSNEYFSATNLGNLGEDVFGGSSAGSGLAYSSWFGYYSNASYPLVYEYYLGYEYAFPSGVGVILYDYTSGHFWYTQASYFPFVYDYSLNCFLYYYQANTPHRHFYKFSTVNPGIITE